MLNDVYLYGRLAEKYGSKHRFDINNAKQAVAALAANYKEFANDFREYDYRVIIGERNKGIELDEDQLRFKIGNRGEVHLLPYPAGAKNGGFFKIIGALALLTPFALAEAGAFGAIGAGGAAAGWATDAAGGYILGDLGTLGTITAGDLARIGVSFLISGVASLLTKAPTVGDYDSRNADQRASFLFNGAVNRSAEGTPIQIVYGKFQPGSIVIASGLNIEQLQT